MATADTKEVRKFFRDLMDIITDRESMRALGGWSIKRIVERTRGRGKGVSSPGGQERKLKRVTREYAAWRREQKSKHPQAAGGTNSNLTLFGPLLWSLTIKRATKSDLRIGYGDFRLDLQAQGQERQGRRFLVLSGKEIKDARLFLAQLAAGRIESRY